MKTMFQNMDGLEMALYMVEVSANFGHDIFTSVYRQHDRERVYVIFDRRNSKGVVRFFIIHWGQFGHGQHGGANDYNRKIRQEVNRRRQNLVNALTDAHNRKRDQGLNGETARVAIFNRAIGLLNLLQLPHIPQINPLTAGQVPDDDLVLAARLHPFPDLPEWTPHQELHIHAMDGLQRVTLTDIIALLNQAAEEEPIPEEELIPDAEPIPAAPATQSWVDVVAGNNNPRSKDKKICRAMQHIECKATD